MSDKAHSVVLSSTRMTHGVEGVAPPSPATHTSRQHRHWMPTLDALSLLISRRLLNLNSLFCIYLSITLTLTLSLSSSIYRLLTLNSLFCFSFNNPNPQALDPLIDVSCVYRCSKLPRTRCSLSPSSCHKQWNYPAHSGSTSFWQS